MIVYDYYGGTAMQSQVCEALKHSAAGPLGPVSGGATFCCAFCFGVKHALATWKRRGRRLSVLKKHATLMYFIIGPRNRGEEGVRSDRRKDGEEGGWFFYSVFTLKGWKVFSGVTLFLDPRLLTQPGRPTYRQQLLLRCLTILIQKWLNVAGCMRGNINTSQLSFNHIRKIIHICQASVLSLWHTFDHLHNQNISSDIIVLQFV